ncbi:MAG TPA: hypothetical protein VK782_11050 [Candidatus Sulfotelmatobacter sp.]|jgi:hypothetical protein|nr:hypothetical protein [Candidatus Sulfotelmatobacter sp.]
MKPSQAAAWGAFIGLLIPIGIYLTASIFPPTESMVEVYILFCLWPGAILIAGIAVAGPAANPLAFQILVLVISLGTNVVLYAMLGWFVARVFGRSVRPRPA